MLKPIKPSDLEKYIANNTAIDIRPFLKKIPAQLRPRIAEIVRDNKSLLSYFITGEKLISKAKEKRPDLWKVLSTSKGRAWTNRFIEYLKKIVFSI